MDEGSYKYEDSSGDLASPVPFKEAKEQLVNAFEREYLEQLARRCGGNVSKASRVAGIDRVYVRKLFKKHNLTPGDFNAPGQV